jgi:hypothetical protein
MIGGKLPGRSRWLTRKEAADLLDTLGCPIAPQRLAQLACIHPYEGPPFIKSRGKVVRYNIDEVQKWALAHMKRVE